MLIHSSTKEHECDQFISQIASSPPPPVFSRLSRTATDTEEQWNVNIVILTLAVCRIHHVWWVRSRLHHGVLRGHARVLGRHRITCMWIFRRCQWFSISVIHGLHRVAGHGDVLGCGSDRTECDEGKVKASGCLHVHGQHEKFSLSNGVLPLCCLLW